MGVDGLGWRHLGMVFFASIAAGFFVVLIDGFIIQPAEQGLFNVVSTSAPTVVAA